MPTRCVYLARWRTELDGGHISLASIQSSCSKTVDQPRKQPLTFIPKRSWVSRDDVCNSDHHNFINYLFLLCNPHRSPVTAASFSSELVLKVSNSEALSLELLIWAELLEPLQFNWQWAAFPPKATLRATSRAKHCCASSILIRIHSSPEPFVAWSRLAPPFCTCQALRRLLNGHHSQRPAIINCLFI